MEIFCYKGARTDLKNNEKKLALDMATNAACASLLKKKQSAGIYNFVLQIIFSFLEDTLFQPSIKMLLVIITLELDGLRVFFGRVCLNEVVQQRCNRPVVHHIQCS